MHIKILVVGKNKKNWLLEGESEYLKRLKKFAKAEIIELENEGFGEAEKVKKTEGQKILKHLKQGDFVVLLSSKGQKINSRDLAQNMQNWENISGGKITFIIGGSFGVSQEVFDRADFCLSFSNMTMLHEMIRVFLLEQVYRAFMISQDSEYHKGD